MTTAAGATHQQEVELKFALDDDTDLGPVLAAVLTALGPEAHLEEGARLDQTATYVDTAAEDLAAARVTLRRRTGGSDDGWHLKLPATGDTRHEVRAALGRSVRTPPVRLRRLVTALTRGAALTPVAELRTDRTVRSVTGEDGVVLVEVVDDRVVATRSRPAPGEDAVPAPQRWRELEVELVDGGRDTLAAVDAALRAAGVRPAGHASKLARTLGRPATPAPPRPGRRADAGEVLLGRVRTQVEVLRHGDPLVRLDAPDAVHRVRVATRRLRSALRTFAPLVDADVAQPLRAELKHLADVLGAARDAEVARERLLRQVGEEDPDLLLGPVARSVTTTLGARRRAAHADVVAHLDSERHATLLADLERFLAEPPLTREARRRADDVLPARVLGAHRRLRRRVAAARAEEDPLAAGPLFHEARKRAKEARYAAEVLRPVRGKHAKRFASAVRGVQEVLGEHQDALVAADLLRELAVEDVSGAAFTFGRLHAAERRRAREALTGFDAAWERASRPGLRKGLR